MNPCNPVQPFHAKNKWVVMAALAWTIVARGEPRVPNDAAGNERAAATLDAARIVYGRSGDAEASVAGPSPTAQFLLTPVNPPSGLPPYPLGTTIVGQELRLSRGGVRVWIEVQLRNWDPDGDGNPPLVTYQAKIAPEGYLGANADPPGGANLAPACQACSEGGEVAECRLLLGTQAAVSCRQLFWICPLVDYSCEPAFVDRIRSDWALSDSCQALADVSEADYSFRVAGVCTEQSAIGIGPVYYGGTLVLDVPQDAKGKYTLGFVLDETFMVSTSPDPPEFIPLADPVAAVVNVLLGKCCNSIGTGTTQCTDGVTANECDALPGPRGFDPKGACTGDPDLDCEGVEGACCDHDAFGVCREGVHPTACECDKCEWTKNGRCADLDCAHESIPTVSHWGLIVITLLLLTGAKVVFGREWIVKRT